MSAVLHALALVVSSACLALSIYRVTRATWTMAAIESVMVCLMLLADSSPAGSAQLASGFALIFLGIVDALITRLRVQAVTAFHVHRSVCLLIMGGVTLSMITTHSESFSTHPHMYSMALMGAIGVIAVAAMLFALRRGLNISALGMIVATGMMSVATITA